MGNDKHDYLLQLVSKEEKERAAKFHLKKDSDNFLVTKGIQRMLIAQYIHIDPIDISYTFGPYGKPIIVDKPALSFNISHSYEIVAFTFHWGTSVGIDIEKIRPEILDNGFVQTALNETDQKRYYAAPTNLRANVFFDLWTRQEAELKCLGIGMSQGIPEHEREGNQGIITKSFNPFPGYSGAISVHKHFSDSTNHFTK